MILSWFPSLDLIILSFTMLVIKGKRHIHRAPPLKSKNNLQRSRPLLAVTKSAGLKSLSTQSYVLLFCTVGEKLKPSSSTNTSLSRVCACVRAHVCVCVHVSVCVCARVRARFCVCVCVWGLLLRGTLMNK